MPTAQTIIFLGIVIAHRAIAQRHNVRIVPYNHAQPKVTQPALDYLRASDQRWSRKPLIDHDLNGTQDAFVLAIGVYDPLRGSDCSGEYRLHYRAGAIDEAAEPIAVCFQVSDRTGRDTALHRRRRHRRRYCRDEPWIERAGNSGARDRTGHARRKRRQPRPIARPRRALR